MNSEDPQVYIDGVLAGDRRLLARTITLIESRLVSHQQAAFNIMEHILPNTGNSLRLGITGIPGVVKSTFIENLGVLLADKGHNVADLAVDPSSRRSGGSILGDKTRMEKLSIHENAFIRPSPTGETLGGVAAKTREIMLICEAAGFDVLIVETVGVGQSETAVASMVDFFLLLMITGAGDALQGIKKGILELAHAVAINKADGDNVQTAEKTRQELESALHLVQPVTASWAVPVVTCSAVHKNGLDAIWDLVQKHRQCLSDSGELQAQRREQAQQWLWDMIDEGLKDRFARRWLADRRIGRGRAVIHQVYRPGHGPDAAPR